jgi:hypothetical protein
MLSAYFNKWLSALTAFSLFFCTNLLYYSVSFGQMAHSYAFFMLCLFLYSLFRFYREHKLLQLYLCAFSAGMLVLIRPSDGIVLLIPLLLGVHSRQEFKTWWSFLGSIKMAVAGAALFFIGIVSLQLIYWKLHTGHFLVNGYGDERFFFNDPQVTNFLFSFRKGLIPYTPIMLLLFPGYLILYRNYRELFWPLIAFQALNIYLLSCWWDWGYGGSFGNRALVDSFPVFAIPIAALFDFIYKRFVQPKGKIIVTGLICLCVYSCFNFNIYLIKKYNSSQIHWSDMTAEAYWFVVLNTNFQGSDFKKLNELLKPVNAAAHKKGKDRDH